MAIFQWLRRWDEGWKRVAPEEMFQKVSFTLSNSIIISQFKARIAHRQQLILSSINQSCQYSLTCVMTEDRQTEEKMWWKTEKVLQKRERKSEVYESADENVMTL